MSKIFFSLSLCATAFVSTFFISETVHAKKNMVCKLQSEKVIQGRERQCLYRCTDGTIEGRTRKVDQECLKTVLSAN